MSESQYNQEFLHKCKAEVNTCIELSKQEDRATKDFIIARLQCVKSNLERAKGNLLPVPLCDDMNVLIDNMKTEIKKSLQCVSASHEYWTPRESCDGAGPPRYQISAEQLHFLADCGFTVTQMASMLKVSASTVKRRLRENEIRLSLLYCNISDEQLKQEISTVTHGNHLIGPNAVRACLIGKGLKVQRHRIRDIMIATDPAGAALRGMLKKPQRRVYHVAGPNSLWHVDGNHKLIRWNMVIHGGIDGFSRMVVFIKVSTNNTAATVLEHFVEAGTRYGFPSRVRCDYGGENNDMCNLMELLRGEGRGSAIRGSSVHNQRIERAWVDVWKDVTNVYYELFYFLEESKQLDPDSPNDLWCLHFVYVPLINRDLECFQRQWNNHGLRTEKHMSPLQLFVSKSLSLANSNLTAMTDLFPASSAQSSLGETSAPSQSSGVKWESIVNVPGIPCPLTDADLSSLKKEVDPLSFHTDLNGIDAYLKARELVQNVLMN